MSKHFRRRARTLLASTRGQVMTEHLAIVGLVVIASLALWAWYRGAVVSIVRGERPAAMPR